VKEPSFTFGIEEEYHLVDLATRGFAPVPQELMAACVEVWQSDPETLHYHPTGYIALGPRSQESDLFEVFERQQRIGYIFDGGFEYPLASRGFGWLAPVQVGVAVSTEAKDGMTGKRALQVAFANKRFSEPPVYQYLMLVPGRYRFDARARTDLESWLGLQWGVYCQDAPGRAPRQLFHTDRLVGLVDWHILHAEFVVPKDCPAQLLRLELANPRSDASSPGTVAVRLNGRLWFDDMKVRVLDSPWGG